MTEAKHTPGPWSARKSPFAIERGENPKANEVAAPDGHVLCETRIRGPHAASAEANARLIAAAPDLLNGCNALLGLIYLVSGRDDMPAAIKEALRDNHRINEARAALTKATGGA